MSTKNSRREFMKTAAISGLSVGLANGVSPLFAAPAGDNSQFVNRIAGPDVPFVARRAASWWCSVEDLQWSQKDIVDKIKRRAAGFAEAGIDTAIIFGFHFRFDFADYFGQIHGYFANISEELHKYNIKFMDHYSCNLIARPRNDEERKKLVKAQRHVALLFHDPIAAKHAQYEEHLFQEICEVELSDGTRGYSRQYQCEEFCHNNPGFLDMHQKYLIRVNKEVPLDGMQVDDMCMYAGLATCGCQYCRARFKRDYGHEIPPFGDKNFYGDISKPMLQWGNYENPAFRDWLRMKTDSIVDHVKMVKSIVGSKPLMTCCSSSGPIALNGISLDIEKMAPEVDLFMLENVGFNVKSVDWVKMDAEALHQKDIAEKRGNAPTIAVSYTIYEKGGYLGWALSRFWGVGNWSSTLNGRLESTPPDSMEQEDVIRPSNAWEIKNSNLDFYGSRDLVEARLVNNRYCRENGWRDEAGKEHWDKVKAWSAQLVKNSVGYRFVRFEELSDAVMLCKENTPLILDGIGCVSDKQFAAIKTYLAKGGKAWVSLPFGTHDEKGFKRAVPLSGQLTAGKYKNLSIVETSTKTEILKSLIEEGKIKPALKLVNGDSRWAAKVRFFDGKATIHFMNTALAAVPHPTLKDNINSPVLIGINSNITDNKLTFELNTEKIPLGNLQVFSPELGSSSVPVTLNRVNSKIAKLNVNLDGVKVYAVAQ